MECPTIKDSKYVKINLIFSKVNGYFEEINIIKYLTLVFDIWHSTNESKEIIKNMKNWGLKSEI